MSTTSNYKITGEAVVPASDSWVHGILKPGSRRSLVVDGLRGACLVFMTTGHVPESPFSKFSNPFYGSFGFFTVTSGFVFLSGWVAGRVYGRHRQLFGDKSLNRRLLNRVVKLYLAQMTLILALGLPTAFHFRPASHLYLNLFASHPVRAFLLAAILFYRAAYLGILPMYFFFLLITPILLQQLQAGHGGRVLAGSAVLWIFSGLITTHIFAGNIYELHPLGYQTLFVMGITLGVQRFDLNSLAPGNRRLLVASCLLMTALFFSFRMGYIFFKPITKFINGPIHPLFSVAEMGPLRLLNFAVFAVTFSWVWGKLQFLDLSNPFFDWLILLGQNSLVVFLWSIASTAMIAMIDPSKSTPGMQASLMLLAVVSLSIPAFLGSLVSSKLQKEAVS